MINNKKIILILSTSFLVFTSFYLFMITKDTSSYAYTSDSNKYLIKLEKGSDLIADNENENVMKNNTRNLQSAIDFVSEKGGGIVYLPAGTFYFSQGGRSRKNNEGEAYVIKCRDNVKLVGAGINEDETDKSTILKPVYNHQNEYGSMDMFYFNNYSDVDAVVNSDDKYNIEYTNIDGMNSVLKNQHLYLTNADFENFILDAIEVDGGQADPITGLGNYNTSGKGFMINLFKNCDWNKVIVRNTDATGFGMDCPINSTITNCAAIGCGNAANQNSGGASGFGIGTGYSEKESLIIKNSVAINNTKFGFFFEHQGRWGSKDYKTALTTKRKYTAETTKGFVVYNSIAGGNMYDFGGIKADNVVYDSVEGISGYTGKYKNDNYNIDVKLNNDKNASGIYFGDFSTNVRVVNSTIKNRFTDTNDEDILWAYNKGITNGTSSTTFSPNRIISRYEALIYIYRLEEQPIKLIPLTTYLRPEAQINYYLNEFAKKNIFKDVTAASHGRGMDAIYWAYIKKIVSESDKLYPSDSCTKAEIITMLYRMAGSPTVTGTIPYKDVEKNDWYYTSALWAYNIGMIESSTAFNPEKTISRSETIKYLKKYSERKNGTYNINYYLNDGVLSKTNKTQYTKGNTFTLNNPSKKGYTFNGWTGSNLSSHITTVTISSSTSGNLSFIAHFTKKVYTIKYNLNDGLVADDLLKSYSIDSPSYTLPTPIKKGYTFNGWTETNSSTASKTVTIKQGSTGNLTYTAHFTSNESELTISSIKINSKPNKTTYNKGESLNVSSLSLTVLYSNGTSKTIDSGYKLSIENGTPLNSIGTKKIIVTYEGKTTSFDVTVMDFVIKEIKIKSKPNKITYNKNDSFDSTGLTINVLYTNGTSISISKGYSLSITNGAKLDELGTKKVDVTYGGKATSFDIVVNDLVIKEITIKSKPNRTTYNKGDSFDTTGLTINVFYTNNTSISISKGYSLSIENGAKLNEAGPKKVTVTYNGKTTSFDIIVTDLTIKEIKIKSKPDKTSYNIGDSFDSTGLAINIVYTDGTSLTITKGYSLSIEKGTTLKESGTKKVTVTYNEKFTSFDINVSNVKISSVKIINTPNVIKYYLGQQFSSEGLSIKVTYGNKTTATYNTGFTLSIKDGEILNEIKEQIVTVTYGTVETSFEIFVVDYEARKIEIETLPNKLKYNKGDKLNTEGLTLLITTQDGEKIIVDKGFSTSIENGKVITESGTINVIVKYKNIQTYYNISVKNKIWKYLGIGLGVVVIVALIAFIIKKQKNQVKSYW